MSDDAFGFDQLEPKKEAANLQPKPNTAVGASAPAGSNEADLMNKLKGSIEDMQKKMQDTYETLSDTILVGRSNDKLVTIKMTATYGFEDIEFDENALQGGMKEFKWRIREAFKDLLKKIQDHTQSQTMGLLQGMQVPDGFGGKNNGDRD